MKLTLEAVRVLRGGRRAVLVIPELEMDVAGVTAILGPNGAGKSTLLRVIAGLESPSSGSAQVEDDGGKRPPTVAMAFQRAPFLQGDVRKNIELALSLRGVPRAQWGARIKRGTSLLGVEHLLSRDPRGLSGGESQRVNVARALAVPADLVLLDEPFAGLDRPSARELLGLLPHALAEAGVPVILVTHLPDEALKLADRALVLLKGGVAASGPLPDLFRQPPTPEVAELSGFTLIPGANGLVAVSETGLVEGIGEPGFKMTVETVRDLGFHCEARGTVEGVPAAARVPDGIIPGSKIDVHARQGRFVLFPKR